MSSRGSCPGSYNARPCHDNISPPYPPPGSGLGRTGFTGSTGTTGQTGASGMEGSRGASGRTGDTGASGRQGDTGRDGDTGASGQTGRNGIDGPDGSTGATGGTGQDGSTGRQGDTGASGAQGDTGSTGRRGDTGASGAQGDTGATGGTGSTGSTGRDGDTGNTGSTGSTGRDGDTGSTGQTGGTGNQGSTGGTGNQGNTGASGHTGDTGAAGVTGASGTTGYTGNTGQTGASGTNFSASQVLYVDTNLGDDDTAIVNRPDKPWLTLDAAFTASQLGSNQLPGTATLIHVRPGVYTLTSTIIYDATVYPINWFFELGAVVNSEVTIFRYNNNDPNDHAIWGRGVFNTTESITFVVGGVASTVNITPKMYIECLAINSGSISILIMTPDRFVTIVVEEDIISTGTEAAPQFSFINSTIATDYFLVNAVDNAVISIKARRILQLGGAPCLQTRKFGPDITLPHIVVTSEIMQSSGPVVIFEGPQLSTVPIERTNVVVNVGSLIGQSQPTMLDVNNAAGVSFMALVSLNNVNLTLYAGNILSLNGAQNRVFALASSTLNAEVTRDINLVTTAVTSNNSVVTFNVNSIAAISADTITTLAGAMHRCLVETSAATTTYTTRAIDSGYMSTTLGTFLNTVATLNINNKENISNPNSSLVQQPGGTVNFYSDSINDDVTIFGNNAGVLRLTGGICAFNWNYMLFGGVNNAFGLSIDPVADLTLTVQGGTMTSMAAGNTNVRGLFVSAITSVATATLYGYIDTFIMNGIGVFIQVVSSASVVSYMSFGTLNVSTINGVGISISGFSASSIDFSGSVGSITTQSLLLILTAGPRTRITMSCGKLRAINSRAFRLISASQANSPNVVNLSIKELQVTGAVTGNTVIGFTDNPPSDITTPTPFNINIGSYYTDSLISLMETSGINVNSTLVANLTVDDIVSTNTTALTDTTTPIFDVRNSSITAINNVTISTKSIRSAMQPIMWVNNVAATPGTGIVQFFANYIETSSYVLYQGSAVAGSTTSVTVDVLNMLPRTDVATPASFGYNIINDNSNGTAPVNYYGSKVVDTDPLRRFYRAIQTNFLFRARVDYLFMNGTGLVGDPTLNSGGAGIAMLNSAGITAAWSFHLTVIQAQTAAQYGINLPTPINNFYFGGQLRLNGASPSPRFCLIYTGGPPSVAPAPTLFNTVLIIPTDNAANRAIGRVIALPSVTVRFLGSNYTNDTTAGYYVLLVPSNPPTQPRVLFQDAAVAYQFGN